MYVTHSSLNGLEAEADTSESTGDPMAKLMGDWSWRPERQPEDPGYVYPYELALVALTFREQGEFLAAARPWMVKRYDGRELVMKPNRVGPAI